MNCPKCGQHVRTVYYTKTGESRCMTCKNLEEMDVNPTVAVFRDGIPGGIVCENYGPNPIRFDSHSERREYMRTHALREKEKFSPLPGTDKDPQGIPNPAGYLDPYTLASGATLIARNGRTERVRIGGVEEDKGFDPIESGVLTGQFSGTLTGRDAAAIASGDVHRQSRLGRRIKDGGGR